MFFDSLFKLVLFNESPSHESRPARTDCQKPFEMKVWKFVSRNKHVSGDKNDEKIFFATQNKF